MKTLPPLEKIFCYSLTEKNRTEGLHQQLIKLADSLRLSHSRPFYSIREIAVFTGLPATLVARVFRRMDAEGHLLLLRSRKTLVTGKKSHPLHSIKGTIGLPVWEYGFCQIHDLRSFYLNFISILKKHYYSVDLIFMDKDFRGLQRQILPVRHNAIVWYEPLPSHYPLMKTAQEQGARNLVLSKRLRKDGFRDYLLDWQTALNEGMKSWRFKGMKKIFIPVLEESTLNLRGDIPSDIREKIEFERFLCPDEKTLKKLFASLKGKSDQGIFFEDDLALHILSRRHGQALCDLFGISNVLLSQSFDAHPVHCQADHKSDVASMNWVNVARSMALDVMRNQLSPRSPARCFRADFLRDIPLIRLAADE